uniref:Uncharacterized protein n=1 Tax=Trichobilharzia regenti TaxID=157069 RepID=A0AA85J5L6_TRIRE|nr:unnamed protein product [Trichobilharzia regenti]
MSSLQSFRGPDTKCFYFKIHKLKPIFHGNKGDKISFNVSELLTSLEISLPNFLFWSLEAEACVGDSSEKCVVSDFPLLTEAVNTRNYGLVAKILMEQDPFEVRRIKMLANTSKAAPNLIASQSSRRMVGCICEPEANSINWLELDKGDPVQCYCGHWFQLVNYEDYFNMTN